MAATNGKISSGEHRRARFGQVSRTIPSRTVLKLRSSIRFDLCRRRQKKRRRPYSGYFRRIYTFRDGIILLRTLWRKDVKVTKPRNMKDGMVALTQVACNCFRSSLNDFPPRSLAKRYVSLLSVAIMSRMLYLGSWNDDLETIW